MSPGLHAPLRARRGAFRPSARAWFVLASVALVLNAAAWWRFAPRGSVRLGAVPLQVVATSPNRFAQLDPQVLVAFDRPMATPAERARPIERPPKVANWFNRPRTFTCAPFCGTRFERDSTVISPVPSLTLYIRKGTSGSPQLLVTTPRTVTDLSW